MNSTSYEPPYDLGRGRRAPRRRRPSGSEFSGPTLTGPAATRAWCRPCPNDGRCPRWAPGRPAGSRKPPEAPSARGGGPRRSHPGARCARPVPPPRARGQPAQPSRWPGRRRTRPITACAPMSSGRAPSPPVGRTQDRDLVPQDPQGAREAQHLTLHATGAGQRVGRHHGDPQWSAPVARPICLVDVPLLGAAPDVVLEARRQGLGDPKDVVAQGPGPTGVNRRVHHRRVAVARARIDHDRDQRCTGAQGERGCSGREPGALAEELDLDAGPAEVAVAHQAGHLVGLQGAHEGATRPVAQRHGGQAHGRRAARRTTRRGARAPPVRPPRSSACPRASSQ